jgi:hypothetical protein
MIYDEYKYPYNSYLLPETIKIKVQPEKNYAGSDEPSASSTASAASSRKFSAGPVVSGSDSAAPTRFWFFCAI